MAVAVGHCQTHHRGHLVGTKVLWFKHAIQIKTMKKLRCAIYTRKSSEDGLEQDPALMLLAGDIRSTSLALSIQRVELLLQPIFG